MKLQQLTPEQEARLPEIRDEWVKIGLSTEPLDLEPAKDAVCRAYKDAGLEPPSLFLVANDPVECALMGATLRSQAQARNQVGDQVGAQVWNQVEAQVGDQVWNQVGAQVGAQVWDQVRAQVGAQVWDQVEAQVGDQVWNQVYGAHDAGWLSFYATWAEFGLPVAERLRPLMDLARVCGWWLPLRQAAILQHRHNILRLDDLGRLHCEDGPAVAYPTRADGTRLEVYAISGVRVSKAVIDNAFGIDDIRKEQNAEVRRIMVERYGVSRYAEESGAKCVHMDAVPISKGMSATMPRALFRFDDGSQWLYGTDGSTTRCYWMPVPSDVTTCREAHFAICGLDETLCVAQS